MVTQKNDSRAFDEGLGGAALTALLLLCFCFAYTHGTASSDNTRWARDYQIHDAAKINNVLIELNSVTNDSDYPVEAMATVCQSQIHVISKIQKRREYPQNDLQTVVDKYLTSLQLALKTCATANNQWGPSDYSFLNQQFRLAAEQGRHFNQIARSKGLLDIVQFRKAAK